MTSARAGERVRRDERGREVAGQVVIGPTKFTPPGHLLPAWGGFAVFCGYAATVLITAAITIHTRDA